MLLTVKTVSNGNTAVTVDPKTTVAQLKQLLDQQGSFAGLARPWKLVHRGELLTDDEAVLRDLCQEGSSLVLLPTRAVGPRPAPCTAPTPSSSSIDAAICEEVARSPNPPGLDDAAQRQRARQAQRAQQAQEFQALEDALAEGDFGALREYLDQLQQALRAGAQAVEAGGGPGAGGAGGMQLPAALQPILNALGQGRGGGVGGGQPGEDENEGSELSDEEEGSGYEDEDGEWDDEEGEEEGSEAGEEAGPAAGDLPPAAVPEVDAQRLASLQEMGFSEPLCRNALLLTRNHLERALEWLIEHADDPGAAEPLSDVRLAQIYGRGRRQGPTVNQARLATLVDMGFNPEQAEEALRLFNNSLEAACQWLINMQQGQHMAGAAGSEEEGSSDGEEEDSEEEEGGQGSDGEEQSGSEGGQEVGDQQQQQEQQQPAVAGWGSDDDGSDNDLPELTSDLASSSGDEGLALPGYGGGQGLGEEEAFGRGWPQQAQQARSEAQPQPQAQLADEQEQQRQQQPADEQAYWADEQPAARQPTEAGVDDSAASACLHDATRADVGDAASTPAEAGGSREAADLPAGSAEHTTAKPGSVEDAQGSSSTTQVGQGPSEGGVVAVEEHSAAAGVESD